jgi:hypothetical protein
VAASTVCGLDPQLQMDRYHEMRRIVRKEGLVGKVGKVLLRSLDATLPHDAHILCNRRHGTGTSGPLPDGHDVLSPMVI